MSVSRVEDWAYTSTGLDRDGIISLTGSMEALGSTVRVDNQAMPDSMLADAQAADRASVTRRLELGLSLQGSLRDVGLSGFSDTLPHRLLGLRLPPDPVAAGAVWHDPMLVAPWLGLLPADLPVHTVSRTSVETVRSNDNGTRLRLTHRGVLRTTPGGPQIEVEGFSIWNASLGALDRRNLSVREMSTSRASAQPGTLSLTLERLTG